MRVYSSKDKQEIIGIKQCIRSINHDFNFNIDFKICVDIDDSGFEAYIEGNDDIAIGYAKTYIGCLNELKCKIKTFRNSVKDSYESFAHIIDPIDKEEAIIEKILNRKRKK